MTCFTFKPTAILLDEGIAQNTFRFNGPLLPNYGFFLAFAIVSPAVTAEAVREKQTSKQMKTSK